MDTLELNCYWIDSAKAFDISAVWYMDSSH